MWQHLQTPPKIPKEVLTKIVFITVAVILFLFFFGGGTVGDRPLPLGNPVGTVSSSGGMMPQFFRGGEESAISNGGYGGNVKSIAARDFVEADGYASPNLFPIPSPIPPTYPGDAGTPDFPTERKIIRNGSLDLVVDDVDRTTKDITDAASHLGGWVESQNMSEYRVGMKSGYLTLRLPSEKFQEGMAAVKLLAVRVQGEQVSSNDVSAQYVDLEAQLKNYKAEEAQYQDIMKRAGKISDVLEVSRELSRVRGQIERTQGQLNYLSRQTAMSQISVSLTPVANAKDVTDEWKPVLVVKESLKMLLQKLTQLVDRMIAFVIADLLILVLQLIYYVGILFLLYIGGRKVWDKIRGKILPPPVL